MSFLHLAATANSSSSSTPSSYLHVNSNDGVSTMPSGLNSSSSSLLGSIGSGKQWTSLGQSGSSSPSTATLAQQPLMKQPNLLNLQSSSSSHFDGLLGSSPQTQMEKNVTSLCSSFRKIHVRFRTRSLNYSKKTFHLCRIETISTSQCHHRRATFSPCITTINRPPMDTLRRSIRNRNPPSRSKPRLTR